MRAARRWRRAPHLVTASLVLAVALVCAPATHAAEATESARLTVSPVIIDLNLRPGQRVVELITLTATGGKTIPVSYSHADFGFDRTTYTPQFITDDAEETTPFSTRGWFSVPQERLMLKSGKPVVVKLAISVPKNATPGTHLGAAFFQTMPERGSGGAQVVAAVQTGPLVLINIEGGSEPKPVLEKFALPRLVRSGPLLPEVVVGNNGDEYLRAAVEVILRGGGVTRKESVDGGVVVPGIDRTIVKRGTMKLGGKLRPGRYEAEVRVTIDPGQKVVRDTVVVWVLPMWLRIVLLLAVIAIAAGLALFIRKLHQRRELNRYLRDGGTDADDDAYDDESSDSDELHHYADLDDLD